MWILVWVKDTAKSSIQGLIAILVLACLIIIAPFHITGVFYRHIRYSNAYDNISVEISEKQHVKDNKYQFSINVTNNTFDRIEGADFSLKAFDSQGQPLIDVVFDEYLALEKKDSRTIELEVTVKDADIAQKLYYLEDKYMSVQLTIVEVYYKWSSELIWSPYEYNYLCFDKSIDTDALLDAINTATSLFNESQWEEAEKLFAAIGDIEKVNECQAKINAEEVVRIEEQKNTLYQSAIALYNGKSYEQAKAAFEELGTYKDSAEWVSKCDNAILEVQLEQKYKAADALYNDKKYKEAYTAFYEIIDYKDSNARLEAMMDEMNVLATVAADIGDYTAAYNYLDAVYYNTSVGSPAYSKLMHACSYAKNGQYKDAVALGLTKIVIPSGTEEISNSMFEGCTGLKEIVMPDTVIRVGDYAFSGCTGIEKMTMSKNLRIVGRSAFANCDGLDKLVLPISLESIVLYGLNSIAGEIHYEGTTAQWAMVTKTESTQKVIYCSNGQVNP